jgi:hypothetical protein
MLEVLSLAPQLEEGIGELGTAWAWSIIRDRMCYGSHRDLIIIQNEKKKMAWKRNEKKKCSSNPFCQDSSVILGVWWGDLTSGPPAAYPPLYTFCTWKQDVTSELNPAVTANGWPQWTHFSLGWGGVAIEDFFANFPGLWSQALPRRNSLCSWTLTLFWWIWGMEWGVGHYKRR